MLEKPNHAFSNLSALNYTRDGNNILAVGQDNILHVYDKNREERYENAKDTALNEVQGNTAADQITSISSSFDQRYVLTTVLTQLRNEIHVWDVQTRKRVRRLTNLTVFPNPLRMCTATRGVGFIFDQAMPHYKVFNLKEGKIIIIIIIIFFYFHHSQISLNYR